MTLSRSTLTLENLSAREVEFLKKIIELGEAFQFFGNLGCGWAFPRIGTEYVDTVSIEENPLFDRIIKTGLIESNRVLISARIWHPTEEAKRIAKERNWISKT